MRREIFDDEHEAFRDAVGTFLDKEVVPHHEQWEKDGIVDREVWAKAGAQGLLGLQLDEEYGGGGTADFRYNVVIGEEMTRRGVYGCAFPLFNDMIVPYLLASANEEQKQRWFPDLCAGEKIAAIAMTEPGAGSDLQGIRTTAVDQGDHYVLNGQKTFISNGILADLVIVVARTDPEAGHKGISLLVVERGMEGFERGRNLDKIGQHAQDTAELFFDDVRVPKENLLGEEGAGFLYLMTNLSQERLSIAVSAATACEVVFDETLALRQGADRVRQADREVPAQPVRARRDGHRGPHRPGLRRRLHREARRRRARPEDRVDGEVVDHRAAEEAGRPGRADARRVRLHDGVPHRPGLREQPRPDDLRRHHRDPEGDHRPQPGPLTCQFLLPDLADLSVPAPETRRLRSAPRRTASCSVEITAHRGTARLGRARQLVGAVTIAVAPSDKLPGRRRFTTGSDGSACHSWTGPPAR